MGLLDNRIDNWPQPESLAGRTALLTLLPLALDEVRRFSDPPTTLDQALWRGTYPALFDRGLEPQDWYPSYAGTYVDRDVNIGDLIAFRTFLGLCAGRTRVPVSRYCPGRGSSIMTGPACA